MIITLIRTGGFTGIPIKKVIDTKKLSPDEAKKVEGLIATSNFFSLESPAVKSGPDQFNYTIAVEHEALAHSIKLNEKSMDSKMKELIGMLEGGSVKG